jgi:putative endonuclease
MQGQWLVYLLRCADDTLYCGITNHLEKRLGAHGRGKVKYTRGRLPVKVAHVETARDKSAALRAEAAWKRLTRKAKLARITLLSAAETVSPEHAEFFARARRRRRARM